MPKVFVYVDETGDRGPSPSSSPIFGMAAVLVPEASAPALRDAVKSLRTELNVPDGKALSWKEFVKTHDRRRRAAEVLQAVPGIKLCYVYAKKSELRPDSYVNDKRLFYNYVAFKTYKSIVWAARNVGATEVIIRFGHVRHHDHSGTKAYIEWQASRDSTIPDHLVKSMKWVPADLYAESQAADVFAGFLKAAIWPAAPYGYVEPSYLISVWPLIRNSEGCAIPLGIMSMPSYDVLTSEAWFPCAVCKK